MPVSLWSPHFTGEIQHFFSEYKRLEGKSVEVQNFAGPETAWKIIEKGMAAYKAKFGKEAAA